MKIRLALVVLLVFAARASVWSQVTAITSSQCASIGVSNASSTVTIQVTGTWTGTLQPEIAIQGNAPANTQVTPSTSTTAQSTITVNGVYYSNAPAGAPAVYYVCGNTVTSGTANVYLNLSSGVSTSTLGGGGATLSSCTNVSTGNPLTCPSFTANGAGQGVLAPSGTSAAPAFSFNSATGTGMWQSGGTLGLVSSGGRWFSVAGAGISSLQWASDSSVGWASSATQFAAGTDTSFSREAAGVIGCDGSAAGNEACLMRSASPCRITADVSLTVNTANSFCSWNLPAVAKSWAWLCDIQWTITAGTGTNNFAVGVNASQTPTGTTNGFAQVYTTGTGTQTSQSTAVSASGATNLLTGATYTPAASVQFAHTSGTLLASATAGTFAVTATANGTTATAAVKAGSTCTFY